VRILFFTDNFPPEGNAPARRTYEHALRWHAAGHEVTVITGAPNFPEGRLYPGYQNHWRWVEQVDGIRVVRVMTFIAANRGVVRRSLDYFSFLLSAVPAGVRESPPDVVVGTSPQIFAALAGWAVAAWKRVPFVFEVRDLWPASIAAVGAMRPSLLLRLVDRVVLALYRRARTIVVVTESFRTELIRRGIAATKIVLVRNGVDHARFFPRAADEELVASLGLAGRFVVGYVGTFGMAHPLGVLLDAAEAMLDEPEVVFLLVGGGARSDEISARLAKRPLANVRVLPRQPSEHVPRLISCCDVAVILLKDTPVFSTVVPSKLFEAAAMHKRVLMSAPEGEGTALVRQYALGHVVPPEDAGAFVKAVRLMRQEATSISSTGAAVRPSWSRDETAQQMLMTLDASRAPVPSV
jgi:colanic acid biosynthesis glycosyl transferase WcaI